MKVAPIVPIPELERFAWGDFHLCLAHLMNYSTYRRHYAKLSRRGAYIVLDNSAHEFEVGVSPAQLLQHADFLNANEVVIPDALFDAQRTVEMCEEFLAYMQSMIVSGEVNIPYRLMIVPQGKTFIEWRDCYHALSDLTRAYDVTVGVSKDYDDVRGFGDLGSAFAVIERTRHADVHLLGWPRHLPNLRQYARAWRIRSTDSARPFVYAQAGIKLPMDLFQYPVYPKRPADFFTHCRLTDKQYFIAQHNLVAYHNAANATGGPT